MPIFFFQYFQPEKLELLKRYSMECIGSTKVNINVLGEIRRNDITIPDDDNLKNYISCVFQKLNFQQADGSFNVENVQKDLRKSQTAVEAMTPCLSLRGSTPAEGAFAVYKCYRKNLPVGFQSGL